MKKILALALTLALIGGCCTATKSDGTTTKNPVNCLKNLGKTVCANKDTVVNILNNVITASNAFIAILPPTSPYIAVAQEAIVMAESALLKACPTVQDAAAAQAQYSQAVTMAQKAGLKIGR